MPAKPSIKETAWGNWYGYLGTKKVEMFFDSLEESQEEAAKKWLQGQEEKLARSQERKEEFEQALSTLQQSVNGGYLKGMSPAKVLLSSGYTVTVQIVRHGQFRSVWWGLNAPDGKTLLGGLTKVTLREKAISRIETAIETGSWEN